MAIIPNSEKLQCSGCGKHFEPEELDEELECEDCAYERRLEMAEDKALRRQYRSSVL